jgi:small subunit ribosomal protein S6
MSTQRQYELVYLLPAESTEQEIAELQTQVEGIVGRFSGAMDKTENWGRRKLAYEIGPHKEAVYVLHLISAAPELVKELDRRLKVTDRVIRHLVVRVDDETRILERRRAARQKETAKRRVRRGMSPEEPHVPAVESAEAETKQAEV